MVDTGDLIHTKPEAMDKPELKVGDQVEADGDAQMLSTGKCWAVEATTVNGKSLAAR